MINITGSVLGSEVCMTQLLTIRSVCVYVYLRLLQFHLNAFTSEKHYMHVICNTQLRVCFCFFRSYLAFPAITDENISALQKVTKPQNFEFLYVRKKSKLEASLLTLV